MKLYKVIFEHNKPVSAIEIDAENRVDEDNMVMDENKNVRWLLVLGFDEQDSLNIAKMIFDDDAA